MGLVKNSELNAKREIELDLLGFSITTLPIKEIVAAGLQSSNATINCFNAHSYIVQKVRPVFRASLKKSTALIPDGSGVVLSLRMLYKTDVHKVAGYDLFLESMSQLYVGKGKVFMLGSSEAVLASITSRSQREFPNVEVATLSPPYKDQFSSQDISAFEHAIDQFEPDVVFVGLTAPKQEMLIHSFKSFSGVKFLAGIGAVFDFYAVSVERLGEFWQRLHLEWLVRFLQNPKHLWRRVIIFQPIFVFDVFLYALRKMPEGRGHV